MLERMRITPSVLRWAREYSGYSIDELTNIVSNSMQIGKLVNPSQHINS